MPDPILDSLNDAQREAVLHGEGPLLVLAGAGSGKTRVIVHRVAQLVLRQGVMPWHVLCVTFTNKAAGEMRERLESLLGPSAGQLWVSTFHAFGARFLRREAAAAGLDPSFPIYDTDDQLRLVKQLMGELKLPEGEPVTARDVLSCLDRWKNDALRPGEVRVGDLDVERQAARTVYARYEQALKRAGAADFGDLLMRPLHLLEEDAGVRARWAGRFRHVLVDEFQDTNHAQVRLVRLLLGPKRNVCVVGDDDQAIYRWRGADVSNILDFDREYEGARVVKLEQNYRSTRPILDAAHAVIAKAHRRRDKKLWTAQEGGAPLALVVGQDEHDEAERIARAVEVAHAQGAAWDAVAVLYRTNAQSRPVEAALRARRIPYVVVRGTSFYERAEVKDAAAYLRLALTPRSDLDLLRVVNRPARGVGERSVERLAAFAQDRGQALFDALAEVDGIPELTPRARKALGEFRALVAGLHERVGELDAGLAVQEVLTRSAMIDRLKEEGTDEAVERAENLMELLAAAREFDEAQAGRPEARGAEDADEPTPPPLARFLEQIALLGDADAPTPEGRVALMTLHAAKGLEFDAVVLTGLEEGVLPYRRPWRRPESADASLADDDEERRLCYVGMTRARRLLTLSLARRRMTYGESGPTFHQQEPSRFLGDLPPELFGLPTLAAPAPAPVRAAPPRIRRLPGALEGEPVIELDGEDGFSAPAPPSAPRAGERGRLAPPRGEPHVEYDADEQRGLAPGDRVVHASLGEGVVRACEGPGPEAKVTVAFYDRGEKRVVARYLRRA
ncbi:ATP-dependent helicase [Anaeromyxobacter diazotrophicus]|uniref:DNA 3'-5' helicase n=1 Tax=Anaeromyxobacter diazotrophicus TaxID=2590199 RepID=A0A7I9VQL1_9BACT|nr:UvrD-helicase domain-containing protein [Anaeromyxobacter diazotrophicus]GEJ58702.1 DNA helicase PcrA [Anaeromyxobacter diazotrophicus]